MHSARLVRRYAFVVTLLFIATVCVMALAPLVAPVSYQFVCSARGQSLVVVNDPGAPGPPDLSQHGDGSGHCPLCMPAAPPPAFVVRAFDPVQPLAQVLRSIPAARLASVVGATLPARGPPRLS